MQIPGGVFSGKSPYLCEPQSPHLYIGINTHIAYFMVTVVVNLC